MAHEKRITLQSSGESDTDTNALWRSNCDVRGDPEALTRRSPEPAKRD